MFKRAFVAREPRGLLLMIGVPVLIVGVLGTFVMPCMRGQRSWGRMERNRRTYVSDLANRVGGM